MRFHTNIDCMKKFMYRLSGLPIDPHVGDLVEVYRDSELIIELEVVSRKWKFDGDLICELHLPRGRYTSLAQFTEVMAKYNIR